MRGQEVTSPATLSPSPFLLPVTWADRTGPEGHTSRHRLEGPHLAQAPASKCHPRWRKLPTSPQDGGAPQRWAALP